MIHFRNTKRTGAEKRGADYEADDNAERLFEPTGDEFYITSIEESDDEG